MGLSGGVDSMVLLHLLVAARETRGFALSAVHVHHGLSPHADAWAVHCERVCAAWQVPLRVRRVAVRIEGGQSLEAVARRERYRVYRESTADAVVLAHHQDDLSETVLLQLLRGGGVRALAAMPAWRQDGALALWRPLLARTRDELVAYAHMHGIEWVDDESNLDTRWRRNLLRHRVMPGLAEALPHYRAHLARSAQLAADAAAVLDEVAAADLAACLDGEALSVVNLLALSAPRQRELLRHWCASLGFGLPTPAALEAFRGALEAGHTGAVALELAGAALVHYRGRIHLLRERVLPACQELPPLACHQLLRCEAGSLSIEPASPGLPLDWLSGGLSLRARTGGERLVQRAGTRAVKQLLQEAGMLPRLRGRWPLLYRGGELVAVPGVALSQAYQVEEGWQPVWLPD
ncbi:tRNA lysidine(34) synthetase TilS [Crenobacter sp. HX-7-9]|uniref:tRNA(Ile)-lysidine synthase n=1 Tax=Crenobacter caeni TaxID=2705474 RepID=A0A6B2KSV5_9NEIS|nr:tRNA lysidine(34) synthetase TilS [Crenobacter caeni]